jgi:hypothetical protein
VNTVPASLISYRQRLEEAIQHDLATRPARRRRTVVRFALAGAAASVLALGVVSAVSNGAPWAVGPASAESVVRHAAAALGQTPGSILHVDMTGTEWDPERTVTWRDESWQLESAPYARRQIVIQPDGSTVESASSPDGDQVYDPATNTIYVGPRPPQVAPADLQPHLERGPKPGTYILTSPAFKLGVGDVSPLVINAMQAKALRRGTVSIAFKIRKQGGQVVAALALIPASSLDHDPDPSGDAGSSADPWSPAFRDEILALLNSGDGHVEGHRTIDGRDTIEISSADGHTSYYVDPDSYEPVELDTRGTDGGTALRFRSYEALPAEGNRGLLDLVAQHPNATVDRNVSDWAAAQVRLFPHG